MVVRRLLIDADAVSKLAQWRMLEELPGLFSIGWGAIATLESVKHRARNAACGRRDKLFPSEVVGRYASELLKGTGEVPEPAAEVIGVLQDVPLIDPGEAILLSAVVKEENTFFISGDKKAMTALGRHVSSSSMASFSQRCICLEYILLQLLDTRGIEWMRERICPHRTLDKAVAAAFGSTCDAPADQVKEGLRSYLRDLVTAAAPVVKSM